MAEDKKEMVKKSKKIRRSLIDDELENVVGGSWGFWPATKCPDCGQAYLKTSHEDDISEMGEYASYCPNCSIKDEKGNIIKKSLFYYGY